MHLSKFWLFLLLVLGCAACSVRPQTPNPEPPTTPNSIATGVAEARAIAATLTAGVPTKKPKPLPTATPNNIATGVAEARAIAATLTAEVSTTAKSKSTITPNSSLERIYFSAGDNLYRMNLDGSNVKIVYAGIGPNEYLAIDLAHQKIYISRWDQPAQILVYDLQSGESIKIFSDGPGYGGQGLAVDPTTSKMYLGLYYNGVYMMDMNDVGSWTQLVDSASLSPLLGQRGQLQIDTANRHVYFRTAFNEDCGLCRYIWRVDFDGNNLIKIIPANGGDALALDLTKQKMYFSDVPGNGTVMRANLDGSGLETIISVPGPYRFVKFIVLDVIHKKMYLSLYDEDNGYKGRAIARLNMDGTEFEILYTKTGNTAEEVSGGIALFLP